MSNRNNRRDFLKRLGIGAVGATSLYGSGCSNSQSDGASYIENNQRGKKTIEEPARKIPVVDDFDLCVVGGGSAGVFAAVRAARLGAKVALVENNGFFGGVATASLVNVWHSIFNTTGEKRIIGGLTVEVLEELKTRGAAKIYLATQSRGADFNGAEMILELDKLVNSEDGIRPFLHCKFCQALGRDGTMDYAVIEDKSGRAAIKSRYFIDATGDGDVVARMGFGWRKVEDLQPPTTCALMQGIKEAEKKSGLSYRDEIFKNKYAQTLKHGFVWDSPVPNVEGVMMVAGSRINSADCSVADELTAAEFEGRRQVRAIRDIIHNNFQGGRAVELVSLPTKIGIRQSRQADCLHRLKEEEVLEGVRFEDAIANGSYRVDVHHSDKPGLTFRYLDGTEVYSVPGKKSVKRRWRPKRRENPTFYQIPYRSLVPKDSKNVLVTGRVIDADRGAFGAVRVMVNGNQTGEAVGTACVLAMRAGVDVADVDTNKLRAALAEGGSVII